MSRFYAVVLIVAMTLWAASGVYNAIDTHYRRTEASQRLCTLSKTLVTFIDDSLSGVPPAEAQAHKNSYERGYALDVSLVRALVDEAPCDFTYTIPPDLLKGKNP